jgi:GNAT superfamily N-acetyltransferase
LLGWAMSTERDGHLELTHFFVDPERQGKGVGRGLIDRAFASHPAAQKSILATQDPAALSLYLRAGVGHVTTAVDILMRPHALEEASDLDFEALSPDAASTETLAVIEKAILGCRRDADLAFLLGQRPAWLARRNGRAVGFAFGLQPNSEGAEDFLPVAGPMAALSPDDVPALIDHVLADAVGKCDEFFLAVPFANRAAMTHTLARGGRIDPFYVNVLSSVVEMKLDRWIHTEPMFIL